MKLRNILIIFLLVSSSSARTNLDFDFDWRFSKGYFAMAMMPEFDDSAWRIVNLPHDWSIEGPFSAEYSSGNGYAPGGVGWYRKHFKLDATDKEKMVTIEFDGIYNNSEVWINGSSEFIWISKIQPLPIPSVIIKGSHSL